MTGQTGAHANQALRETAAGWLVRVQSDQATAEDWAALTEWLEASDDHVVAFDQAESLSLDIADQAADIAAGLAPEDSVVTPLLRRSSRPAGPPAWMMKAAAVAAVALLLPLGWSGLVGHETTYATQAGETRHLVLADGSQVDLDSMTKLSVRQTWGVRRAKLETGEASFEVTKNPKRPFIVAVADQEVRVVGTQFNIRHYDGFVDVAVRRGVVRVSDTAHPETPVEQLTAGQGTKHAVGQASSTRVVIDPDAAFAWTKGQLVYQDRSLAEVVADLNLHYATQIRISPAAAKKTFSGVLILEDEDAVVRRLAAYCALRVNREGGVFTLG